VVGALIGEDGRPDKARERKIRPVFQPGPGMSRWRRGQLRIWAALWAASQPARRPGRARVPNHRSGRKNGVGPPDAVNTGGPGAAH
jgi:hypothetical protein